MTVSPERGLADRLERWVRALPGDRVPAVVLGGSVNALSNARSLGRRGVPVLLVDHGRRLATYSRYCTPLVLDTDADHTGDWLGALRAIGDRLPGPAVLLATADELVSLVADHAALLSQWFRFLVPDADTVATIVDKSTQYDRARAAGISVPDTRTPTSLAELTAIAAEVSYPVLLKPRSDETRRAFGHKARPVDERAGADRPVRGARRPRRALPRAGARARPRRHALYGYWAFWDADGHEHSWITRRKLRQYPLGFGTGACQESVAAPDVAALSRRLLEAFAYRGLVGVEWKRDARDGRLRLMEINPRTVIGNQLAISAGIDLPWIAYRALADPATALAPNHAFKVGVRWINEDLDPKAFRELRRTGQLSTAAWVRSLLGARSWALWSWRDPAPFLHRFRRFPSAIIRRLSRRGRRLARSPSDVAGRGLGRAKG